MAKTTAEIIIALERSLHRGDVRTDPREVAGLLAENFIEFGSSGRIFDKQMTVAALAAEDPTDGGSSLQAQDFAVQELSVDVVLVTYRINRLATQAQAARQTLRSSIWKRIDNRWQMVFHQGTVVPDA
jgi:hypothetical protein